MNEEEGQIQTPTDGHPSDHKRCPRCGAVIKSEADECPECDLVDNLEEIRDLENENDGPKNKVLRFFWGLGLPLDLWIIAILAVVWLLVLSSKFSAGYAAIMCLLVFGLPLIFILYADVFASMTYFKFQMEEVNPLAIKMFFWVYMIGFQLYWIYLLSK